jgi:hypothetical protein
MDVLKSLYANVRTHPYTNYDYHLGEVMPTFWANFIDYRHPNGENGDGGVILARQDPEKLGDGDARR